jgi:hypothetical protein
LHGELCRPVLREMRYQPEPRNRRRDRPPRSASGTVTESEAQDHPSITLTCCAPTNGVQS